MAELADAADSKSADLRVMGVRPPLPAPISSLLSVVRQAVPVGNAETQPPTLALLALVSRGGGELTMLLFFEFVMV